MVVISGLCAISGLCGLRGGSGGMGGRLRKMEARSCCVGLAGCLREAMETVGGVSTIGISRDISVDEVSREGDETMVIEGPDSRIVPSTMAVVGGVSVVNVRLARTWRLMMRAWRMRLRAR